MGDARGALRERSGAFGAWRGEPRAPAGQGLMRRGEALEYFKILAAPEPFAQPFGFVGPHPAEPRPERLDQFHLIAQLDNALAKSVQIDRIGRRPIGWNTPPRAAIAIGQLGGDGRKVERI